jgi:hypothetical protein
LSVLFFVIWATAAQEWGSIFAPWSQITLGSFQVRLIINAVALLMGLIFLFFKDEKSQEMIKVVFLAALCLDLCSYQYDTYMNGRGDPQWRIVNKSLMYTFDVNKLVYQPQRTMDPLDARAQDAMCIVAPRQTFLPNYTFAQFDVCWPWARVDFVTKNLDKFLSQGLPVANLEHIVGCTIPKLRLEDQAGKVMTNAKINVKRFTSDDLIADVDAPARGAWLVYADNNHPSWKAEIDGQKRNILNVYETFKAVYVKGHQRVSFVFRNNLDFLISHFMMFYGVLVSLVFICFFIKLLVVSLNE